MELIYSKLKDWFGLYKEEPNPIFSKPFLLHLSLPFSASIGVDFINKFSSDGKTALTERYGWELDGCGINDFKFRIMFYKQPILEGIISFDSEADMILWKLSNDLSV
jgi:hypothetical protein